MKDGDIPDMNKDRFMDMTGDNFTIDKRPQKVIKGDDD